MGLFPLVEHERPLHLAPIRAWVFPEGIYVLASPERPELVGTRIVAIEGKPVAEVAALVRPLVTRDNESSLILRLPEFMITGEILHGLGLSRDADAVRLTVERAGGERLDATLRTLPGPVVLGPDPARLGSAAPTGRADAAVAEKSAAASVVREAGEGTCRLRRVLAHELVGHVRRESPEAGAESEGTSRDRRRAPQSRWRQHGVPAASRRAQEPVREQARTARASHRPGDVLGGRQLRRRGGCADARPHRRRGSRRQPAQLRRPGGGRARRLSAGPCTCRRSTSRCWGSPTSGRLSSPTCASRSARPITLPVAIPCSAKAIEIR